MAHQYIFFLFVNKAWLLSVGCCYDSLVGWAFSWKRPFLCLLSSSVPAPSLVGVLITPHLTSCNGLKTSLPLNSPAFNSSSSLLDDVLVLKKQLCVITPLLIILQWFFVTSKVKFRIGSSNTQVLSASLVTTPVVPTPL